MLKFVVVVVAVAVRSSISDEYNLRCWLIQDRIPFLSKKKNGDGDELNKNGEDEVEDIGNSFVLFSSSPTAPVVVVLVLVLVVVVVVVVILLLQQYCL